ncbi:MAG: hypothetical protein B5M53_08500 [Candidatus Cloacimonas sp. 4484_209]|nr:MAG: hypothetical protein B5M53_08500 [Candidatus Cloacimonas sp. 4484_209]
MIVYEEVVSLIQGICKINADKDFSYLTGLLHDYVSKLRENELLNHLLQAGVISERFHHDSTEEKLYAKYCDLLLSKTLTLLGIKSNVVEGRGNAPDVIGEIPQRYKIVGDAKAFRLSRTAKNQKDFKVEALNTWRKEAKASYAFLVGPLYQFPSTKSQIYHQAIRYNVTLMSYTHLYLVIQFKSHNHLDLEPLWKIGQNLTPTQDANIYWEAINTTICKLVGAQLKDWEEAYKKTQEILPEQAKIEISFWESEKQKIKNLSHEEAVNQLIKTLNIDRKIKVIKKTAGIIQA